jgi:putative ABC transport system ATP-binding protein
MIDIINLIKTYNLGGVKIHALAGINLHIDKGDMVAIMGPSGSGKSTLMNILGCLDRPDSGKYILAEEDVSSLSRDQLADIRNRKIGFVFQSFNLLPRMSAIENVELPLLYGGKKNARNLAQEALNAVGLGERMFHEPNQLSGGQRQRVAIARAIATDPAIILADEPTGNLDSKTGEEILAIFENLNQQGRTIIMVTHEDEFQKFADRVIKIDDGRIVAKEKPR